MGPRAPCAPRNDDLLLAPIMAAADKRGEQARDEKEDAIHDAKGKTRLEHGTCLVNRHAKGIDVRLAEDAEGEGIALGRDAGAGVAGDAAQVPDAGDEGADEAQVDEGDEMAIV